MGQCEGQLLHRTGQRRLDVGGDVVGEHFHGSVFEPIDDALERMTEQSLSVIPVLDRETEQLLGGVTSQDILGLIVGTGEGSH